jgi:hypothetical protein
MYRQISFRKVAEEITRNPPQQKQNQITTPFQPYSPHPPCPSPALRLPALSDNIILHSLIILFNSNDNRPQPNQRQPALNLDRLYRQIARPNPCQMQHLPAGGERIRFPHQILRVQKQ